MSAILLNRNRIQLPTMFVLIVLVVVVVAAARSTDAAPAPSPATWNTDSSRGNGKGKLDLEVEHVSLSPKLIEFYERLYAAEPETMESGLINFREVLSGSKNSDEFLEQISRNNEDEQAQAKIYLAELVQYLQADYPKVLQWLLSTTYGENNAVTRAQLNFLESFSRYDEEMSRHDVWNKYWRHLFRMIGDFIVNHNQSQSQSQR